MDTIFIFFLACDFITVVVMLLLTTYILAKIRCFARFDDFPSLVTAVALVYCLCLVPSVIEKVREREREGERERER